MISVVVPAYNEGMVIERCLRAMLEEARPGELEIVVVCNGCKDDTAARVRKFGPMVTVIETPEGGKIHALNLGDEAATSFPRFYVDADIELSTAALRDVVALLGDDSPILAAAPKAVVDYRDRSLLVRSFYEVWTRLPYFDEGMIGAGVYAFSRRGRARFDKFPDIIADDAYARLVVAPHERRCSSGSTFTITPPTTLRGIVQIKTRVLAGNYELRRKFPELVANETTDAARSLRVIAITPRLWPHAPIYLGVMAVAKLLAHRKLEQRREREWNRDETSRAAAARRGG
ncbi:MAG: glycosyltransferase [Gammaproteobacteria bacterium]